jgi:hypothetical protein
MTVAYAGNNPKDIIGLSQLMVGDNNNNNIMQLEKEIIIGANTILEEEANDFEQYKLEMEKLETTYNVDNSNNFDDDASVNGGDKPKQNGSILDDNSFGIKDTHLKNMTIEQQKQDYVNEVLGDINANDNEELEFDIDKEKDEDDKNALLEQIDTLRDTLDEDGINLSNIPLVTSDNSITEIKNIYKVLKLKNDRNRYCTFAEELILAGSYGFEYIFDGKNEYFGRKIDLRGWSNTVRIKLRRSRYQTSTLIKDMLHDYNIGPGIHLLMELVPSMFLYSNQKNQANYDNVSNDLRNDDSKYNDAISQLNSINT